MLSELHVQNLALVEDVWLEFGPGLTVLTGETGAGKTVLVSALKLLLGDRADSSLVREGAEEALVEGRFVIDGVETLVRRRLTAEGRSRCTIDGEMATVTMLAELLGSRVDLHGQHEHQALLSPGRHAGYLDRFIGEPAVAARARYAVAWRELADTRARLLDIDTALADRDRRADYLRFQVQDIDRTAPQLGEVEALEAELPRLRHGERLAEAAGGAWGAIRDEGGSSDGLSRAITALGGVHGLDPELDTLASSAMRLDVELQELATSLRDYVESVERDPGALDATERRLRDLGDLTRKYGPAIEDVLAVREAAARELELLDAGEAGLARARDEVDAAADVLRVAAAELAGLRDGAVSMFCERLAAAAADLALPDAAFAVERSPLGFDEWTADGPERVEFLFSSAAGESPRPLAKIASGGEISRVMLALKGVLGAADSVPVLVFDEVDAGIGGATAVAVGRRLASLACGHQVLVVTHLPQVAAYADSHVVVSKSEAGGRTVTTAQRVEGDGLIAEIARMLAGSTSPTSIAHARELISSASPSGAKKG